MKKEAIWSNLPIGDPGLPSNLTERDISKQYESPDLDRSVTKQGESEIEVDWLEFGAWYSKSGEHLPEIFSNRTEPSVVNLTYNYNETTPNDIVPIQLLDYLTKQTFTDPYLVQSFFDHYDDQIKSDINISEEGAARERSSDYNPLEE